MEASPLVVGSANEPSHPMRKIEIDGHDSRVMRVARPAHGRSQQSDRLDRVIA
jgi:hypothetical protein